ncbi:hypothetical protein BLNAU_5638 [Blattamonas nauphoetae]|uniref:Uncharacterized protein n=1 Tax=Blattamonas nauphoetae TaxID=2049346 RepID=A0ABQ9Y2D8_9EUKA|nr:hypothetical protein BLNAU_14321 [Blattamonas nauphoetae]KAK2957819.1 hypothetical protein BLNAU_7253 [Blattamonas nauphoetae]KAK2959329.1 hypothetical protein BLNAU_5638 [Blattamonas nauphoetae]
MEYEDHPTPSSSSRSSHAFLVFSLVPRLPRLLARPTPSSSSRSSHAFLVFSLVSRLPRLLAQCLFSRVGYVCDVSDRMAGSI